MEELRQEQHYTIPGPPIPAPRMTQRDRWKQRPAVLRYWAYRDTIRDKIGQIEASQLRLSFYLAFPKSYSSKKRQALAGQPHQQKPDADNLAKAVLDALFIDDAHVWSLQIEKHWEDQDGPRTIIEWDA